VLNPWDALVRVVERATPMGVHFWYGVFSAPHLRNSTLRILDYLARKSQEIHVQLQASAECLSLRHQRRFSADKPSYRSAGGAGRKPAS